MNTTAKVPGWGLKPIRNSAANLEEKKALTSPKESESNLWVGLKEVCRYQGRIIYQESNTQNNT
jgi:hypothetical protein